MNNSILYTYNGQQYSFIIDNKKTEKFGNLQTTFINGHLSTDKDIVISCKIGKCTNG